MFFRIFLFFILSAKLPSGGLLTGFNGRHFGMNRNLLPKELLQHWLARLLCVWNLRVHGKRASHYRAVSRRKFLMRFCLLFDRENRLYQRAPHSIHFAAVKSGGAGFRL